MKTFQFDINNFPDISVQNLAIGKFDGIHKGHEALLLQEKMSVLTFNPLPYVFFGIKEKMLYTIEEKTAIFKNLDIENLLFLEFNHDLANYSGNEFLKKISKITKEITVGSDFKFGKGRTHGVKDVEKFGIKVNAIKAVTDENDNEKMSSSALKQCVEIGDFIAYKTLSTIAFHLTNEILHGEKIAGNELNTPTLNMVFPENKITPPFGVYATQTTINGITYNSISNFGIKPTLSTTETPLLETHVFNFSQNVYKHKATVSFIKKIREEKKFIDTNQLHFQIMQDIQNCKKIHGIL